MTLDDRRTFLLSILQHISEPISSEELQQQMKVSERTIYYDLEHINHWLEKQGLPPISKIYGKGFLLEETAKQSMSNKNFPQINDWQYKYTAEERQLLITTLLFLSPQEASMKNFMEITMVSRGTAAKDLRYLKEELFHLGIILTYKKGEGYVVDGEEVVIRNHLMEKISHVLPGDETSHVAQEIYRLLKPNTKQHTEDIQNILMFVIYEAEELMNLTFTDEMINNLIVYLLIFTKRCEEGHSVPVPDAEKETIHQTEAFDAAKKIAEKLENHFSIKVPEDDISSIAIMLLGSKVLNRPSGTGPEKLREVVRHMVENFQTNACILFDDQKGLEENMLAHVIPAYYRVHHDIPMSNQLSQQLQESYQDLFHLTKKSATPLEYFLGETLPDEEISYLSFHFGGWLYKEKKQVKTKYQAVIVCENGIGTSGMVKSQLESVIAGLEITATLSMREYHSFTGKADIIFSTNYLKPESIPVIHVPVIINNEDKERIIRQVNILFDEEIQEEALREQLMGVIEKYTTINHRTFLEEEIEELLNQKSLEKEFTKPMLNELLTKETTQFKDSVSDWEEAIRIAAEPLLEKQTIQLSYVEAMIESVKELGAYIVIAPGIAIPHARPEAGVNRLGMSFLRLREPVAFSDKKKHQAQLIFVLAAIDNNTHLKALAQLTEILSDEKNVQSLIHTNNSKEVIELIEENIASREEN